MTEKKEPTRVPADPEKWSEKSKQSLEYEFGRDEYVDIHYLCWRCEVAATYSAEDQRIDYEVRKAYIWKRRFLCADCWRQRSDLEKRIRECNIRWSTSKDELRRDTKFLQGWMEDLQALPGFSGKRNDAHIAMLRRLLGISD